jgi:predicted esterase
LASAAGYPSPNGNAPKPAATPDPLPANIEEVVVKTRSPENSEVPFYLRIPKAYRPQAPGSTKLYRVLFFCPAINFDGLHKMLKDRDFLALADERGWFMLAPTFHQNGPEAHDRKLSYYYPETFSGQAVLDALDHFKEKYPIATYGLLLHGFSGGAQFVHRFAIWAPERVAAVAVHTSSWFDDPTPACSQVAWLVTVGESDPSADNTYDFVAKLRQAGAVPLLRSYIGIGHTRSYRVPKLEYEFLKYYDDLRRDKAGQPAPPG